MLVFVFDDSGAVCADGEDQSGIQWSTKLKIHSLWDGLNIARIHKEKQLQGPTDF